MPLYLVVAPIALAADLWIARDGALPVVNNRLLYLPLAGLLWLLMTAPRVARRPIAIARGVALAAWIVLSVPVSVELLSRFRAIGEATERTASAARSLACGHPDTWVVLATPPDPFGFVDSGAWFPFAMRQPFSNPARTRVILSTAHARALLPEFENVIRASGVPVFVLDAGGRAAAVSGIPPPGDPPGPRIEVAANTVDVRLVEPAAWRDVTLWIVTQGAPIRTTPVVDTMGRLGMPKAIKRLLGQLTDLYAPLELLLIVRARDTAGRRCQSVPVMVSIDRAR